MSKILKTLLFILVIYVLPLSGKINLLTHPRIVSLIAAAIILFQTQPEIKADEIRNQSKIDRFSVVYILGMGALAQIFPLVDWTYFGQPTSLIGTYLGLFLIITGLTVRLLAINALGQGFTATVNNDSDKKLVTNGVYSIVRHPSYFGAFMAIIGSAVYLHSVWGLLISFLGMLIVYVYRIKLEEKAIAEILGEEYDAYKFKVRWRIIPFIW